jgi:uncharacterized delta-60 repeat protein
MTAPVLDNSASPSLPTILEGATNPAGISIASLIVDGSITDPDGAAVEAIAITGLNTSLGAWQYSLDSGATWLTIQADQINSTTNELALLLGPAAMVRLLPFSGLTGTLDDAITFRAWDQSSGSEGQYVVIASTGGTTAFSVASDTASAAVAAGNHAPTFAPAIEGTGKVLTDFAGGSDDGAQSVVLQPDGKIVVAGYSTPADGDPNFAVARYNADGSLDTTFGGTGKVTTDLGEGPDIAWASAIQADGKILVTGFTLAGGTHNFAVVRYDTDGSVDTGFNGSGKVITDIGSGLKNNFSDGIAVQSDGKIVLAGTVFANGSQDFGVMRYNADGSLDTSFNGTGKVTTDIGTSSADFVGSVTVQADGKIVVVGDSDPANLGLDLRNGHTADFAIARYNADGTLDTTFNGTGTLVTDIGAGSTDNAESAIVQTDGKIVVAGFSGSDFAVARYKADGSLDTGFNGTGKVVTDVSASSFDGAYGIAVQGDGKIVVVGSSYAGGTDRFAVIRYNTDGSLDTDFGGTGKVVTAVGTFNSIGISVEIQADGKIVVAGATYGSGPGDAAIVRYNADGSLDTTFTAAVDSLGGSVSYVAYSAPIALDGSVAVYDADLAALSDGTGNYGGASITLSRDGGANADDLFSARGNLSLNGGNAVLSGVTVGTVVNAGGQLSITFNSNATQARVNEVLSDIAYANNTITSAASVAINYVFSDGNSGTQGGGGVLTTTGTATVNITVPGALTLSGTAGPDSLAGSPINDMLSGLAGNDTLQGFAGDDTLLGGAGNDSMDGSEDSDLYVISAGTEHTVAEIADTGSAGTDEVRFAATSSSTLTLFAGDTGIERVVIGTGTGAVADSTATTALGVKAAGVTNALWIVGNAGANALTGTAFNDTLDGGAGNDKMAGGNGNDTYIVDSAGDAVTESSATGGTDLVMASVSATLGTNVENLTLTGSAAINGIGNALSNTIIGNSARNAIDGKAGVDHLDGADGSDLYVIGLATDHTAGEIADTGASGTDEVRFAGTKASTLTLYADDTGIEQVTIGTGTGIAPVATGTAALNVNAAAVTNALSITGNAGPNVLTGTAFDDTLNGGAGADTLNGASGDDTLVGGNGSDLLTGGGGADAFVFNLAPNASSNKDTITDFTSGTDMLQLSKAVFTAISGAVGGLTTEQFWSADGAVAGHDADDRIIYNPTTGALYYDADGNGVGTAMQIALLGTSTHPALAYTDIALIL